jgi:RimJ/RimL family protein N-acetyltransferase
MNSAIAMGKWNASAELGTFTEFGARPSADGADRRVRRMVLRFRRREAFAIIRVPNSRESRITAGSPVRSVIKPIHLSSSDATGVDRLPLEGTVAVGRLVSLGWPEPAEYDLITELRNRPATRACFLDSRMLDPAANRLWLSRGMNRPHEGLLSLRFGVQRVFCGTIGWSDYEPRMRTLEIGRLMVDTAVLRTLKAGFPAGYIGVAADAATALLDFAFETLGLDFVSTVFIAGNALARRINVLAGGQFAGDAERQRPDGSRVRVTCMRLNRQDWHGMRASESVAPVTAAA